MAESLSCMEPRDDTRPEVIVEAARLFNHLGYNLTSLDVVERELSVGAWVADPASVHLLENRESLALAAFDFAVEQSDRVLYDAADSATNAGDQLSAIIAAFRCFVENPPIEGGCPVFDAALQSGSALPFLEERAREAVSGWRRYVRQIVRRGIKLGEIRPSAKAEEIASIIVGTMEGAIFLHRIYNDPSHLDRSVAYLERYLNEEVRARD